MLAVLAGCSQAINGNSNLAGTDGDQNGVRDDVDSYIRSEFVARPQRNAAEQYGRALQKVVMMSTADEAESLMIEVSSSMACIYSVFEGGDRAFHPAAVSQKLEDETFDTNARKKANDRFGQALDGLSWGLSEGETCE